MTCLAYNQYESIRLIICGIMGRIFQDIKYNHLIHINKTKLRYSTFNVVHYISLKKKKNSWLNWPIICLNLIGEYNVMHLKCYSKKNYARKSYQIIEFNRFSHIIKSKENFPQKKKKPIENFLPLINL